MLSTLPVNLFTLYVLLIVLITFISISSLIVIAPIRLDVDVEIKIINTINKTSPEFKSTQLCGLMGVRLQGRVCVYLTFSPDL